MSEISYQSTSRVYDVLQEATQRTEEDIKNFIAKYRYLKDIDDINYVVDAIKLREEVKRLRKEIKRYKGNKNADSL